MDDGEPNGDMWVRDHETSQSVIEFCHRAWAHADSTIDALPLDAMGEVPWWPEERRQLSLHRALVHVIADIQRHAGHADLVRELIDGAIGAHRHVSNVPTDDDTWWTDYRGKIEAAAARAGKVS